MVLGGASKMSASGKTSKPQPVTKRRHSQVDPDTDDEGPRRVVTPPFDPGFLGAGHQDNVDASESGFRSTVFQGHGSGFREPDIEHDDQQYATAARPDGIIEISDDSSDDGGPEDDREMPDADPADDGPSNMFFVAAPDKSNVPAGSASVSTGRSKHSAAGAAKASLTSTTPPGSLKSEYRVSLSDLAKRIPAHCMPQFKVGTKSKWKPLMGAVRYLDQLHGTMLEHRIANDSPGKREYISYLKKTLFEYMKSCPGIGFQHGKWKNNSNTSIAINKALVTYFDQCNNSGVQISSKKDTAATQKADNKRKTTSDIHHATAVQGEPAFAPTNQAASGEDEETTRGIRELSVADPPRGIDEYYQKRFPKGYHYIQDIPTKISSPGVGASAEPSAKADIRANSKKQRFINHRHPPTKIQEFISDLEADYLSRTKNQGNARALPARDAEQDGTVVTNVEIKPASELVRTIKSEEDADKKLKSIKTEASEDVDPGHEIVAKAMTALQQSVKGAMSQKLDWDNVPVALFEAEMGIRRVQKAIDEAKEVVAKHGYQVKRT